MGRRRMRARAGLVDRHETDRGGAGIASQRIVAAGLVHEMGIAVMGVRLGQAVCLEVAVDEVHEEIAVDGRGAAVDIGEGETVA